MFGELAYRLKGPTRPRVGVVTAIRLNRAAVEIARGEDFKLVEGFAVVARRKVFGKRLTKPQLIEKALGEDPLPRFVEMARLKALTVHKRHRSVSIQREAMQQSGYTIGEYGGAIPVTVAGGVPLFKDGKYVGALAFSGGLPDQDQEICRRAALKMGLQTDLPKE